MRYRMQAQSINFINFQPSNQLRQETQNVLEHVYSKSPPSADVKIRIEKHENKYTAHGTIDTSRGVYVGYSSDDDVQKCVSEMQNQLEGRLITVRRVG